MNAGKPEDDALWLRELLAEERELAVSEAHPPEAALVYWQGIQAERLAWRRKAMRPILLVERIAWLSIAAMLATAAALLAPAVDWDGLHTAVKFPTLAPVTAGVLLGLSLLLLVGWLVWNEE